MKVYLIRQGSKVQAIETDPKVAGEAVTSMLQAIEADCYPDITVALDDLCKEEYEQWKGELESERAAASASDNGPIRG